MNAFRALWQKLRSKAYREYFVEAQVKQAIPFQIRALMKEQGLSQAQLAARAGLTQGVISRAANPQYGNLSLNTLVRVAAGLDVAFVGRFVPFSELSRWLNHLSEDSLVSTFEEEDERLSKDQPPVAADHKPSALREAVVAAQSIGTVPQFRLTPPKPSRQQPATLLDFESTRKTRPLSNRSLASELTAVSQ